eukprot:GHRR01016635.1.p1 GENE.GHRR01016635.1~~GHRR01016635.1.p1  ORF type:complete len:1115 (+),score=388.60 GHRR01016635.1:222-3566(+)
MEHNTSAKSEVYAMPPSPGLPPRGDSIVCKSPVKYYAGNPAPARPLPSLVKPYSVASLHRRAMPNTATVIARVQTEQAEGQPVPSATAAVDGFFTQHPSTSTAVASANAMKPLQQISRGSSTVSAAERHRANALLLLEQRLARVSTELANSQELSSRLTEHLAMTEAQAAKELRTVKGSLECKLEAAQSCIARQHIQRWQHKLLTVCIGGWQHRTLQARQLQHAWRRMRLQRARACWSSWHMQMQFSRQQAVHSQYKSKKLQQLRLQRVLHAWQQETQHRNHTKQQIVWAGTLYSRKMVSRCHMAWHGLCMVKPAKIAGLLSSQQRHVLCDIVQGWFQEDNFMQSRQQFVEEPQLVSLQQAFSQWQQLAASTAAELQQLQQSHQQKLAQHAFTYWVQLPAVQQRYEAAAAAFASTYMQLLKQWGYQAFCMQRLETHAAHVLQLHRVLACLSAWKKLASGAARRGRLVAASIFKRQRSQLQQCCRSWIAASIAAYKQAVAEQRARVQETLTRQRLQLGRAQARDAAAQSQLLLLDEYNQQLQAEVAAACTGALAGLQFVPSFQWKSLPCEPKCEPLVPRARQAVLKLAALQPAKAATADAQTPINSHAACRSGSNGGSRAQPTWCGCLLVYGGVVGDRWLTDLTLLQIEEHKPGSFKLQSISVPHVSTITDASQMHGSAALTAQQGSMTSTLPLPVRDFAACVCSSNQFVVSGGFDGHTERLDLQLCVLQRQAAAVAADSGASQLCGSTASQHSNAAAKQEASDESNNDTGSSGCTSEWVASWQLVQARNRVPLGRCHHSICFYSRDRSLVVFGGWASRRGCLNDLWLFHLDHMEWWQPDTNDSLPSCRRSHAAALSGHQLFVHGGVDSHGIHLRDLWCLDMKTWTWQQPVTQGEACPSPRRAHSLEVVDERYLLLHGGYAGTQQLLSDTWVYDSHTGHWLMADMQSDASEMPVPRALHTCTQLGSRYVVIGGQGQIGPVGGVHLLECPALQRGLQLQQQSLLLKQQLVSCQLQCTQLKGDMSCSSLQLKCCQQQLQALSQRAAVADRQRSILQAGLQECQFALAAAEQRARQAEGQVAVLERRLLRARQGGNQAVGAARDLESRIEAAGEAVAK